MLPSPGVKHPPGRIGRGLYLRWNSEMGIRVCLSVSLQAVTSFPFGGASINKGIEFSGHFCLKNARGQRLLIRFL